MQTASDRFVVLRGGLTLPVEAVMLVLDLETRGLDLSRDGDLIVVRPSGQLTDADRAALKRWKGHVLALISHVEAVQ